MRHKIKEWFFRYFLAEVIGTFTAIFLGLGSKFLGANLVLISFCGTWGENIGYYGYFVYRELKSTEKTFLAIIKKFLHILFEFGPAECLDSLFIRPLLMYYSSKYLENIALGLIVGKLLADVFFYFFVILAYEIKKKFLKH